MARAPRIEYRGAFHHVINRGLERRAIFGSPSDCECFLDLCSKLKERHKIELLAYCLMLNHFHLFVRTALANLHCFMKDLTGEYSRGYNRRSGRIGPLFQGRYKGLLIQDDAYALDVARYIHMNPVKAGLVVKPEVYRWSSYHEYIGRGEEGRTDKAFIMGYFSGTTIERIRQLRRFTTGEHETEYDPGAAKGGVIAGIGAFLEWARKEKIPRKKVAEIAGWKELREPDREVKESLEKRVAEMTDDKSLGRKLLVYAMRKSTPLSLKEIAKRTGMASIFAVSQTVRRLNMVRREDRGMELLLDKLDTKLRTGQ